MALYTSNYLKTVRRSISLKESERLFSTAKAKASFDIFLSHSFLDKEDVEGLFIELTNMGFSVYVDWIVDPHLDRSNVTKASATHIRNRLKVSKSLILAISINAATSKWMPWELGFMDGKTSNCSILPVSNQTIAPASYKGVEYLSIYPFISKASDMSGKQNLWAVEEADKYEVLNEWINGTKPSFKFNKIF
jgi:hypothetical protein